MAPVRILPWGVGLAAHAMVFYQNSSWGLQRREQTIRREIELEKRRLGLADETYEKPKRDQVMRLSDDGEMIPADDDDAQQTAKAKRGQL
jgi:predicted transcriptional regulator